MCGFAGILTSRPIRRDLMLRNLEAMVVRLRHRGPDGSGAWIDPGGRLALGLRRLSILDLSSAGAQPMTSASGRYTIVFNGEVYNHTELRELAHARSHRRFPMGPRIRRFVRASALYTVIVAATLFVADLLMILFGLFPPPHNARDPIGAWLAARPTGYPGDPVAGWVAARPTGQMRRMTCREFALSRNYDYQRNEDGVRTSFSAHELRDDDNLFKVAVTGDSQTELCAPNELAHFGVLERELHSAGLPAAAFSYAAGKYSPLQAYLAVKLPMQDYDADVLVLNVYTGNDIYDMLRADDRPHFVRAGNSYEIAPPVWYQDDPPDLRRRSRVLYALSAIGTRTGLREAFVPLRYLYAIAAEQGLKLPSVAAYVNDLRKSAASDVGYPDAFVAQMLNQQLFFHHFPGTGEESMRRLHALLELVRRENPNRMLVLSALPSYQLISKPPVDPALLAVLERLPLTYEAGVREEKQFYAKLRDVAEQSGWGFVDNLRVLREYTGADPLYNDYDYHFLPIASEIIGKAQAKVIAAHAGVRLP